MTSDPERTRRRQSDTDAVLTACRLLVGVSAQSVAAVSDRVTLTQLRILTVVGSRRTVSLRELAGFTGLHMSRASRACDRLVGQGLIRREYDAADRRTIRLTLSPAGRTVIADVAEARRTAIRPALRRLTAAERADLVNTLQRLTDAAGEPAEADLWNMGWAT